jgi:hypothetical protein
MLGRVAIHVATTAIANPLDTPLLRKSLITKRKRKRRERRERRGEERRDR